MDSDAADLARRLGREAEAVCRHYLSNGRRRGAYWIVGDTDNTPGRSLYVRLAGSDAGPGAAGKWADAATGEHGDLLDLIASNLRLSSAGDVLAEARSFLGLPKPEPSPRRSPARAGSPEAARRLFAMAQPIAGTLAATYLRARGIVGCGRSSALRFHPRCHYWRDDHPPDEPPEIWPALLARVTDSGGRFTGVHRTWLDPSGAGKAPVDQPRKAMGRLLGHGARFGVARDVLAAGEGIETMFSFTTALPDLPVVAALSANNLAALVLPPGLERLYVAVDADDAGETAAARLADQAEAAGVEALRWRPRRADFNEDLCAFGVDAFRAHLRPQLAADDVARYLHLSGAPVAER